MSKKNAGGKSTGDSVEQIAAQAGAKASAKVSAKAAAASKGSTTPLPAHVSWMAFGIIMLAQVQMAFNVNAIPVSVGPISDELSASATDVGTALVIYSLFVAAFVILGAKLGKIIGERLVFQVSALAHGAAMALMASAPDVRTMNLAQAIAGLAAALLVPTLVVLIAANYKGRQQEQALGILAGAPAISGALAFFVAGFLATALSWRISFGMLAIVSVLVLVLSFWLPPVKRQRGIQIDFVGAVLAAVSILLIIFGFNNLNNWGLFFAKPGAPFNILGISPSPVMMVLGIVVGQAFITWLYRRQKQGKSPLLAIEVIDSREEQAATLSMFVIGALGPAVNFLIPIFMQIVQGRTSFETSVAMVPYTLSVFIAATLIVRLFRRFSPRTIGVIGFFVVAVGLVLLAWVLENDISTVQVIIALVIVGIGEGALLTLVFNVLVSASPKKFAGDVGALRGTVNNMSTALGTAVAGVLAVGILSALIGRTLIDHPTLIPELVEQVNLDNVNFISNDQLQETLAETTTATPEQIDEAVQINYAARLAALKISFLVLAGISLLTVFPAARMPNYVPRDLDPDDLYASS